MQCFVLKAWKDILLNYILEDLSDFHFKSIISVVREIRTFRDILVSVINIKLLILIGEGLDLKSTDIIIYFTPHFCLICGIQSQITLQPNFCISI